MRDVRLYDDDRKPVWREVLKPGECAVLHVDAKSGRACKANGDRFESRRLALCAVFRDSTSAIAYATAHVAALPTVACQVFDPAIEAPIRTLVNTDFADGFATTRAIRRGLFWGVLFTIVGLGLAWYDANGHWLAIWPTVIALKLLTLGPVFAGTALVRLHTYRDFWSGGRASSVLLRDSGGAAGLREPAGSGARSVGGQADGAESSSAIPAR